MRRVELLMGIVLLLALFLGGAVLVLARNPTLLAGRPAPPAELPGATTGQFAEQTAMISYGTAQQRAGQWQPDAMLLTTTATWPPVNDGRLLTTGTASWAYTFYSPATGRVAIVTVVDKQASLINERPVAQPLSPLQASGWQIDSNAAIRALLERGGADFIGREGTAILTMTLSTDNETDRIEWLLALIGQPSRNSLTMRLDANTGEILHVQDNS